MIAIPNRDLSWTYDDFLIEPTPLSDVSHKDVDLSTRITSDHTLDCPIVMAPMETIAQACEHMNLYKKFGILPWLHRYVSNIDQATMIRAQQHHTPERFVEQKLYAIAVSSKPEDYTKRIEACLEAANGKPLIVKIDVANGSSVASLTAIQNIKRLYPIGVYIFSGNVCSREAAMLAIAHGADGVMVGIGGGSACTTRTETGIGKGNAHALYEIANYVRCHYPNIIICADGGFKKSADMVKALVLGADLCMSGRLFQTGNKYYGMASQTALESVGRGDRDSFEGDTLHLPERKYAEMVKDVGKTLGSIKSALSYMGCRTIKELHNSNDIRINFITRAVQQESLAR